MGIGKKINLDYWFSAIEAGKRFRKKYAKENDWPRWRSYYRGNWNKNVLPHNLFFSIIRTLIPRIYFRNPGISITSGMPSTLNSAFAQILERVDNKLMSQMGMKNELKKMIQDGFLFGTAFGKLGFGAEYTPSPINENIVGSPIGNRGQKVEYNTLVFENMPWFLRTQPGHIIVPDGSENMNSMAWRAHQITRPLVDVKADRRFSNTKDLVATRRRMDNSGNPHHIIEEVILYEIRDMIYERVIVIAEGINKPLYVGPDEFQDFNSSNLFDLIFNWDDEVFWGIPESVILEPYQLEINEIRTQAMKHRRLSLIKLLYKEGAISKTELEKATSEDVLAAIAVKADESIDGVIRPFQVAHIPNDLTTAGESVKNDVREMVGFSRNQAGEYSPKHNTSATEARIVQMASEVRVDERRDMVADLIVDVFNKGIHKIIFNHWDKQNVVDIVGPGGVPLWVEFTGSMLRDNIYSISVDPDNALPITRGTRTEKAVQVYTMLKENPLIDPTKLTRYLLRELHGVDYDDMVRGVPEGAGMSQNKPLQMGELQKVLENGKRQIPEGG